MATLFNTKIKDTYQSLLKLEDNTILTTTTKNVTDGLGNASPLYMSTTQVRIGSTSGSAMYWDNVNNRLGIGTSTPTAQLTVNTTDFVIGANAGYSTYYGSSINGTIQAKLSGSNDVQLWFRSNTNAQNEGSTYWPRIERTNNGGVFKILGSTYGSLILGNDGYNNAITLYNTSANQMPKIGINNSTPTALLQVTGVGSTSATTSLLVQNSGGTELFTVKDGGSPAIILGANTGYSVNDFQFFDNGGLISRLRFQPSGSQFNGPSGGGQIVLRNISTVAGTEFSGTNGTNNATASIFKFTNSYAGNMGVGTAQNFIEINPTGIGNQGGTPFIRAIYINNTTTGFAKNIAFENTTGDVLLGTTSGNVGIGTSTPGNRLSVNGSSDFTLVGNNNHGKIVRVQNTDSTNTTFGLGIETYSDGGGNRSVDLVPYNHTGANLSGTWGINTLVINSDLRNNYWSDFNIYHWNSNAGQAIKFYSLGPSGSGGVIVQFVNNGNVQIGTTTDSGYKLDVNGSTISRGNLTVGNAGGGVRYDLTFNTSWPGAGTRGGIVWNSGASILNSRKYSGGNDNTISFLVANNTLELLTIQEHNGTITTNNVGINNSSPAPSAILDVTSTTKGFLLPRMLQTQRTAISSPAIGLMVYQTDMVEGLYIYKSTGWTFII